MSYEEIPFELSTEDFRRLIDSNPNLSAEQKNDLHKFIDNNGLPVRRLEEDRETLLFAHVEDALGLSDEDLQENAFHISQRLNDYSAFKMNDVWWIVEGANRRQARAEEIAKFESVVNGDS